MQVRAVRGIDLDVRPGVVVLIMGPSGSGKTTLLSMLGAMLRPTSGRIEVDGVDLAALPESKLPKFRARRFGFLIQDFNLLSALSAEENVELASNLAGITGRRARDRARTLLGRFGLHNRLGFLPEKLSGGEKQRVAIARALAKRPGRDPCRRAHGEPRFEDRARDRTAPSEGGHRAGSQRRDRDSRRQAEGHRRSRPVARGRGVPVDERDVGRSGLRDGGCA